MFMETYALAFSKNKSKKTGRLAKLLWKLQPFALLVNVVHMILVRAHYLIDMYAGFAVGVLWSILAEKLTFYPDVIGMGYRKSKRASLMYQACPKCGWSNERAANWHPKPVKG